MVRRLIYGIAAAGVMVMGAHDIVALAEETVTLHEARKAADDLEIAGVGDDPGALRYLRYADLASLRRVAKTIQGNADFGKLKMQIVGIYLEQISGAVGAGKDQDLIDAWCADRYRSHFPAEYVAKHHPILVLTVDGQRPSAWAVKHHLYDPGPYFVTYEDFVPAFRVLSHEDEAQLPANVVRLTFNSAAKTFGVIAPKGNFAAGSVVGEGFVIAKQNCLRCHNSGNVGGTKAGWDWVALSTWAREEPAFFAKYVRDPKSVEAHAHMPGNPTYDEGTLAALTAYFRTFTDAEEKR
jgi:mono/diheme cytochrome c family protein